MQRLSCWQWLPSVQPQNTKTGRRFQYSLACVVIDVMKKAHRYSHNTPTSLNHAVTVATKCQTKKEEKKFWPLQDSGSVQALG